MSRPIHTAENTPDNLPEDQIIATLTTIAGEGPETSQAYETLTQWIYPSDQPDDPASWHERYNRATQVLQLIETHFGNREQSLQLAKLAFDLGVRIVWIIETGRVPNISPDRQYWTGFMASLDHYETPGLLEPVTFRQLVEIMGDDNQLNAQERIQIRDRIDRQLEAAMNSGLEAARFVEGLMEMFRNPGEGRRALVWMLQSPFEMHTPQGFERLIARVDGQRLNGLISQLRSALGRFMATAHNRHLRAHDEIKDLVAFVMGKALANFDQETITTCLAPYSPTQNQSLDKLAYYQSMTNGLLGATAARGLPDVLLTGDVLGSAVPAIEASLGALTWEELIDTDSWQIASVVQPVADGPWSYQEIIAHRQRQLADEGHDTTQTFVLPFWTRGQASSMTAHSLNQSWNEHSLPDLIHPREHPKEIDLTSALGLLPFGEVDEIKQQAIVATTASIDLANYQFTQKDQLEALLKDDPTALVLAIQCFVGRILSTVNHAGHREPSRMPEAAQRIWRMLNNHLTTQASQLDLTSHESLPWLALREIAQLLPAQHPIRQAIEASLIVDTDISAPLTAAARAAVNALAQRYRPQIISMNANDITQGNPGLAQLDSYAREVLDDTARQELSEGLHTDFPATTRYLGKTLGALLFLNSPNVKALISSLGQRPEQQPVLAALALARQKAPEHLSFFGQAVQGAADLITSTRAVNLAFDLHDLDPIAWEQQRNILRSLDDIQRQESSPELRAWISSLNLPDDCFELSRWNSDQIRERMIENYQQTLPNYLMPIFEQLGAEACLASGHRQTAFEAIAISRRRIYDSAARIIASHQAFVQDHRGQYQLPAMTNQDSEQASLIPEAFAEAFPLAEIRASTLAGIANETIPMTYFVGEDATAISFEDLIEHASTHPVEVAKLTESGLRTMQADLDELESELPRLWASWHEVNLYMGPVTRYTRGETIRRSELIATHEDTEAWQQSIMSVSIRQNRDDLEETLVEIALTDGFARYRLDAGGTVRFVEGHDLRPAQALGYQFDRWLFNVYIQWFQKKLIRFAANSIGTSGLTPDEIMAVGRITAEGESQLITFTQIRELLQRNGISIESWLSAIQSVEAAVHHSHASGRIPIEFLQGINDHINDTELREDLLQFLIQYIYQHGRLMTLREAAQPTEASRFLAQFIGRDNAIGIDNRLMRGGQVISRSTLWAMPDLLQMEQALYRHYQDPQGAGHSRYLQDEEGYQQWYGQFWDPLLASRLL